MLLADGYSVFAQPQQAFVGRFYTDPQVGGYCSRCCRKNRTISAEASGPLGSVYEPG